MAYADAWILHFFGSLVPRCWLAQQPRAAALQGRDEPGTSDAYVSKDDVAVTDLKAEDFEVYEDDKLQTVEGFQLVTARAPIPQTERINSTNVRDMRQEAQDTARVFTLFFDRLFVSLSGSYRARKPIIETMDRVIGPDDLIGVMTPDMSPGSITYSRRTTSIENFVTETWHLGAARSPSGCANVAGADTRGVLRRKRGHARISR